MSEPGKQFENVEGLLPPPRINVSVARAWCPPKWPCQPRYANIYFGEYQECPRWKLWRVDQSHGKVVANYGLWIGSDPSVRAKHGVFVAQRNLVRNVTSI